MMERELINTVRELLAFVRGKYPKDYNLDGTYNYLCPHHKRLAELIDANSTREVGGDVKRYVWPFTAITGTNFVAADDYDKVYKYLVAVLAELGLPEVSLKIASCDVGIHVARDLVRNLNAAIAAPPTAQASEPCRVALEECIIELDCLLRGTPISSCTRHVKDKAHAALSTTGGKVDGLIAKLESWQRDEFHLAVEAEKTGDPYAPLPYRRTVIQLHELLVKFGGNSIGQSDPRDRREGANMKQSNRIPRPNNIFTRKDFIYMRMALETAKASKCERAKYGSVLVTSDDRVVATAYNGKPRGSCNDNECYRRGLKPGAAGLSCCIHSEANLLIFANPVDCKGGTLYVSGLPCHYCMLLVANSGISRVVALRDGHDYSGIDRMGPYGLNIIHEVMNYEELS